MLLHRRLVVLTFLLNLTLIFSPGLPPYGVEFVEMPDIDKVALVGALAANSDLDEAVRLTTDIVGDSNYGIFDGPESFALKDGHLYTGIFGGDILRLDLGDPAAKWERVFHFGEPCAAEYQERKTCGRPLGLDFDREGKLVVADMHKGVYRVDLQKGTHEMLVPDGSTAEGSQLPVVTVNGVTASRKEDAIYFTQVNSVFNSGDFLVSFLAASAPTGRVLKYDYNTQRTTVVSDGLYGSNGVVLSEEEDFLVVSEFNMARMLKIRLSGPDTGGGTAEVFARVPGTPDNVSRNGRGGFLVGIPLEVVDGKESPIFDVMLKYPRICRFLARVTYNVKRMVSFLKDVFGPSDWLDWLEHSCGTVPRFGVPDDVRTFVVELDSNGEIERSWQGLHSGMASEALVHDGRMYVGGYLNEYVMSLPYDN